MCRALSILLQVLLVALELPVVAGHKSLDTSICPYNASIYFVYPECPRGTMSMRSGATETVFPASTAITGGISQKLQDVSERRHSTSSDIPTRVPATSEYNSRSSSPPVGSLGSETTSSAASLSTQVSTTQPPPDATKPEAITRPDDTDTDNYLDPSSFLSFDEWKTQNFAKAGLSSEDINKRRADLASAARKASPEHPLDTIGDDMEIDISMFSQAQDTADDGATAWATEPAPSPHEARGQLKYAGKTSRERSNYASVACAAGILKTNPEMRGASAILFESKDTYMLNPCSVENKFVIIELCEDILVDTVVLANYEFFSSMVRKFRVSVSARYPVKASGWKVVGEFDARNVREIQPFLVRNSPIFARFLRIEFLSHWGQEFYCPLSLVRVHGTTMMEEYEEYLYQDELNHGEEDEREDVVAEAVASEVDPEQIKSKEESAEFETQLPEVSAEVMQVAHTVDETIPVVDFGSVIGELSFCPWEPYQYARKYLLQVSVAGLDNTPFGIYGHYNLGPRGRKSVTVPASVLPCDTSSDANEPRASGQARSTSATDTSGKANGKSAEASSATVQGAQSSSHAPSSENDSSERSAVRATASPSSSASTPSMSSTASSSSFSAPQNNPTTQESVYKTIMKRLTLLEANATLSLQYIEEQSRMLRDAFSKVERRQNLKLTDMLDGLNATVTSQLYIFKQQYEQQRQHYEQLWQQTVAELESQRKQTEKHLLEIVILLFCVCIVCVAFDVYIVMKMKIKIL
ncbi:UNC-like C-terminal-domain-containing protein [Lipomyces tetrasporus]